MADTPRADLLVLFGGTGDLARRMLLPSLYHLDVDGFLPQGFRVIATARAQLSREAFLEEVRSDLAARHEGLDAESWARFCIRLDYISADATRPEGLAALKPHIDGAAH